MRLCFLLVLWIINEANLAHPSDMLNKCINEIIGRYYSRDYTIYAVNDDWKIDYPLVIIDVDKPFKKIPRYSNVDLYILRQNEALSQTMKTLFLTREFTPRAIFIVISEKGNPDTVFSMMAYYYIYKLIILDTSNDYVILYSYKPFQNESVQETNNRKYVIGECKMNGLNMNDTFEDLPSRWRNTTIDILLTTIWAPYVYLTDNGLEGVEMDILRIVQRRLGFQAKFIEVNYPYWGHSANGSYTMIYKALQKREGDMMIGMCHTKFAEHLDFDMTASFSQDAVYWVVPAAKVVPAWQRISLILSPTVWMALFISLAVSTIIMYILFRKGFISMLYQILVEQGIITDRVDTSFRIILTAWTLACLIVTTAFKSNMMIIFIGNIFGYQMESLKDIVESRFPIYLDHDMANVFKGSPNPYEQYALEHYRYSADNRGGNNRTAFVGDIVTTDVKKIHKYLFPKYYIESDGTPLLHMLNDFLFTINVNWFFVKGYPLVQQINNYIGRISSAGITFKLWNTLDYGIEKALKKLDKFQLEALNLDDLSIAFFLWGMGLLTASVTLIVEILVAHSQRTSGPRWND